MVNVVLMGRVWSLRDDSHIVQAQSGDLPQMDYCEGFALFVCLFSDRLR